MHGLVLAAHGDSREASNQEVIGLSFKLRTREVIFSKQRFD